MKIQAKDDGTFIVDFNGMPFHVTPEYPKAEQYGIEMTHAAIKAYAKAHPDEVCEYAEPAIEVPEMTDEEKTALRIYELEAETQKLIPSIQAGIDAEYNQQKLVDYMLEIEELKGNLL